MMTDNTQTYWNELVEKYRNGSISDQERFKLEKQALDDPFLFDALEGFALYENPEKESKPKPAAFKFFTLPRIATAASIVLLVSVMVLLRTDSNNQQERDSAIAMVLEDEKPEKEVVEAIDNEAVSQQEQTPVTTSQEVPPPKTASKISGEKQKSSNAKKDQATSNSEIIDEKPEEVISGKVAGAISPEIDKKEGANNNDIVDVSIDEDETGADVFDQIEQVEVAGSANAITEEEIAIIPTSLDLEKKNEDRDIVPVKSEADSNQWATKREKAKTSGNLYFEAVPVIGKKIFDEYAKERIDERGLRQEKPQEVTIEFTIDKNGNLKDFHHIFTGCSECGPFAISILQNSGEWKTLPPGFSGKARYTFIF